MKGPDLTMIKLSKENFRSILKNPWLLPRLFLNLGHNLGQEADSPGRGVKTVSDPLVWGPKEVDCHLNARPSKSACPRGDCLPVWNMLCDKWKKE